MLHRTKNYSVTSTKPKLAFAFMVHSEETVQGVIEMMEVLYPSDHCFLVHFDKKTPAQSIATLTKKYPVLLMAKQFDIEWGKFSMIEAELELLQVSQQCEYDHILFLDGKTFPMKGLFEIELQFQSIPKRSSIVFSTDPSYGTNIPTCLENSPTHHACARTRAKCINDDCTQYSSTPNHAPLFKGPQWTILSSLFVNHMLNETEWLQDWKYFFTDTTMPDESFFQSVLMDSKFNKDIYLFKEDWLKVVWKDCKTHFDQRSKKGYSPCTLGVKDCVPHLLDSNAAFVRKINPGDQLKSLLME